MGFLFWYFQWLKDAYYSYFGGTAIVCFLLISLIIIFSWGDKAYSKAICGYFVVFSILAVLNPVSYYVIKKVYGDTMLIPYTGKLLATAPIFVCIPYGLTILIKKINPQKKILLTIVLIISFVFVGKTETNYALKKSENVEKIPNDIFQISEILKDKEEKNVMPPIILSGFIRQIDSSITLPYTRNDLEIYPFAAECLSYGDPDADIVIEYCKEKGCNYVVAFNTKESVQSFTELGGKIEGITNNYVVFDVSNAQLIEGWKKASIR